MIKKLKKWNWGAFLFVLVFAWLGALGNKSVPTILDSIYLALIFGIPFGLIFAFMGKED